jgi:hypothetical protein
MGFPIHLSLTRIQALLTLTFAAALAGPALGVAEGSDRVVALSASGNLASRRVEITNPTSKPITFTLGFNDHLFEDSGTLVKAVRSRSTAACRRLNEPMKLPCEAFQLVASSMFHFPDLTDQWGNTGWAPARWWAESPMLGLNSIGFGTCGALADILAKVWQQLGYETRRRELNGHTVTEVLVEGRWALFDADIGGFFVNGKRVSGLDEMMDDLDLASFDRARPVRSSNRKRDFPRVLLEGYGELLNGSLGTRTIAQIPQGSDDWRDLILTLPPGGRLVFPEKSGDDCLFPAHTDYSDGRDLTSPAHQYALIEVPAGTVTDMVNGLYPAQIVGDYCVDVQYPGGSIVPGQQFDQIRRFRYARRFGREFKPLEAHSNVLVYYMLNANVTIRKTNDVRLHGDGVNALKVALTAADPSYLPPDPSQPCAQVSGLEAIPVRLVTATSNSPGYVADLLVDNKLTTGWASDIIDNAEPQTVILDLGGPRWLRGIRWAPHVDYGMLSPSTIVIETSQNGEEYDEVARVDDYRPTQLEWDTRMFERKFARYVRLTLCPQPHFGFEEKYQATLGEVEVLN